MAVSLTNSKQDNWNDLGHKAAYGIWGAKMENGHCLQN
jgi:hypothetical protein